MIDQKYDINIKNDSILSLRSSKKSLKASILDDSAPNSSSVHTHVTSDANSLKRPSKDKYKLLTSRKFFTSVLAAKLSAYELIRMKQGEEVGKWVRSISYDALKALKQGDIKFIKTIHHKDGRKEKISCKTDKYGYLDANGDPVIYEHQKRWIRLFHCGTEMVKFQKDDQDFYSSKQHDCGDRMCMRCARKKGYQDFVKYKDVIMQELKEPVMLVLHQRNPKAGDLAKCIEHMYNDLRAMNKQNTKDSKKGKCKKWSYYWSFEMTVNVKQNSFHPHFHMIVEKAEVQKILNAWINKCPGERTIHAHKDAISKPLKSENDLIECFKYVTKIATDDIDENGETKTKLDSNGEVKKVTKLTPIPMLYEMLMAMYGKRRNGAVGKIYNNKLTNDQSKEKVVNEVRELEKKNGFNVDDNPIIELCESWIFSYKDSNYFGDCEGTLINLANYKPTKATKEFLGIIEKDPDPPENQNKKEQYLKLKPMKGKPIIW